MTNTVEDVVISCINTLNLCDEECNDVGEFIDGKAVSRLLSFIKPGKEYAVKDNGLTDLFPPVKDLIKEHYAAEDIISYEEITSGNRQEILKLMLILLYIGIICDSYIRKKLSSDEALGLALQLKLKYLLEAMQNRGTRLSQNFLSILIKEAESPDVERCTTPPVLSSVMGPVQMFSSSPLGGRRSSPLRELLQSPPFRQQKLLSIKNQELRKLKQELNQLESEKQDLDFNNECLRKKMAKLEQSLKKVQEENSSLKCCREELEMAAATNEKKLNEQSGYLQRELSIRRNESTNLTVTLQQVMDTNENLSTQNEKLKTLLTRTKSERDRLAVGESTLKRAYTEQELLIEKQAAEIVDVKNQLLELQQYLMEQRECSGRIMDESFTCLPMASTFSPSRGETSGECMADAVVDIVLKETQEKLSVLETDHVQLKNKFNSLSSTNENLQVKVQDLNAQLETAVQDKEALRLEKVILEEVKSELEKEKEEISNQVSSISEELQSMKIELSEQVQKYETVLKEKDEIVKTKEVEDRKMREKLQKMAEEIKNHIASTAEEKNLGEMREKNIHLQAQVQDLSAQLETAEQDKKDLRLEKVSLEEVKSKLEDEKEEISNQVSSISKVLQSMKSELSEQVQKYETVLKEKDETVKAREVEERKMREELQQMAEEIKCQIAFTAEGKDLGEMREKDIHIQTQVQDLSAQLEIAVQDKKDLRLEKVTMEEVKSELENKKEEISNQVSGISEELQRMKSVLSEQVLKYETFLKEKDEIVKGKEVEERKIREELQKMAEEIKSQIALTAEKEINLGEMKEENIHLQDQLKVMEDEKSCLSTKIQDMEREKSIVSEKLQKNKAENSAVINDLVEKCQELKQQLKLMTTEHDKELHKVQKLEAQLVDQEKFLCQSSEEVMRIRRVEKTMNSLREELKAEKEKNKTNFSQALKTLKEKHRGEIQKILEKMDKKSEEDKLFTKKYKYMKKKLQETMLELEDQKKAKEQYLEQASQYREHIKKLSETLESEKKEKEIQALCSLPLKDRLTEAEVSLKKLSQENRCLEAQVAFADSKLREMKKQWDRESLGGPSLLKTGFSRMRGTVSDSDLSESGRFLHPDDARREDKQQGSSSLTPSFARMRNTVLSGSGRFLHPDDAKWEDRQQESLRCQRTSMKKEPVSTETGHSYLTRHAGKKQVPDSGVLKPRDENVNPKLVKREASEEFTTTGGRPGTANREGKENKFSSYMKRSAPIGIERNFICEDEEELFNSKYIAEMKLSLCRDEEADKKRLSELQRRNSLYLPHMRSSYAVEMQFRSLDELTDDQLQDGIAVEDQTLDEITAVTEGHGFDSPAYNLRKRKSNSQMCPDLEDSDDFTEMNLKKPSNYCCRGPQIPVQYQEIEDKENQSDTSNASTSRITSRNSRVSLNRSSRQAWSSGYGSFTEGFF